MSGFPWTVLGIRETSDRGEIRRAYSARLKALDLDRQIAEYAELRQARDHALWLAANPPQEDDDFGLGSLDDDEFDDFGDAPVPTTYNGDDDFEWEIRDGELAYDGNGGDHSLGAQPGELDLFHARREEPELPDGWTELAALIFPSGMQSNEPLTPEEADEADAALDRLIAWAEEGDIERQTTLDHNLAEMLAGGWPRSAPVVEKANTAFHWLGEAGGLDERPALQFLNARTEGMRFHDAVEQDGHPLHAAWRELQQPGKVSVLGRIKGNRSDIERLLQTIRGRFPELESLLDAERVVSWEAASNDVVSWIVQRLFFVFLLIQALRFCAFDGDRFEPNDMQDVTQEARIEALHIASNTAFGATYWWVRNADSEFAKEFERFLGPVANQTLYGDPHAFVRGRILASREHADFDQLVQIQALNLDWLRAAAEKGQDACREVLDGSFSEGGPGVTQEVLDREHSIARSLLESGLLRTSREPGSSAYHLPAWLVLAAQRDVGMSRDRFSEVLQDPTHPERCKVQIALIDQMLTAPAKVPIETLRGL